MIVIGYRLGIIITNKWLKNVESWTYGRSHPLNLLIWQAALLAISPIWLLAASPIDCWIFERTNQPCCQTSTIVGLITKYPPRIDNPTCSTSRWGNSIRSSFPHSPPDWTPPVIQFPMFLNVFLDPYEFQCSCLFFKKWNHVGTMLKQVLNRVLIPNFCFTCVLIWLPKFPKHPASSIWGNSAGLPSQGSSARSPKPRISYQLGMAMPPFNVTAWMGAVGNLQGSDPKVGQNHLENVGF